MATIDLTGCGATNGAIKWDGLNKHYVLKKLVDLTPYTMVASDVYQLLAVPANTLVANVKVKMVTPADGTALTGNFGDGSAANGWDANVNLKGSAGTITTSLVGTDAYAAAATQGTYYATADSIDLTLGTVTAVTASPKFWIFAECIDYN